MKKLLPLFFIAIFFASCSTSKDINGVKVYKIGKTGWIGGNDPSYTFKKQVKAKEKLMKTSRSEFVKN